MALMKMWNKTAFFIFISMIIDLVTARYSSMRPIELQYFCIKLFIIVSRKKTHLMFQCSRKITLITQINGNILNFKKFIGMRRMFQRLNIFFPFSWILFCNIEYREWSPINVCRKCWKAYPWLIIVIVCWHHACSTILFHCLHSNWSRSILIEWTIFIVKDREKQHSESWTLKWKWQKWCIKNKWSRNDIGMAIGSYTFW